MRVISKGWMEEIAPELESENLLWFYIRVKVEPCKSGHTSPFVALRWSSRQRGSQVDLRFGMRGVEVVAKHRDLGGRKRGHHVFPLIRHSDNDRSFPATH